MIDHDLGYQMFIKVVISMYKPLHSPQNAFYSCVISSESTINFPGQYSGLSPLRLYSQLTPALAGWFVRAWLFV